MTYQLTITRNNQIEDHWADAMQPYQLSQPSLVISICQFIKLQDQIYKFLCITLKFSK